MLECPSVAREQLATAASNDGSLLVPSGSSEMATSTIAGRHDAPTELPGGVSSNNGIIPGRRARERRDDASSVTALGCGQIGRVESGQWQDRGVSGERQLPEGLGGVAAWRAGDGVHRPIGPWTPTVHALLRHLEAVGFDGAPRVVRSDHAGREVLSFIEGDVLAAGPTWRPGSPTPWPSWARTEECLVATARLLRRFHDAAATFAPPDEAVWRRYHVATLGSGEVVCHGDIGPHNTVYRSGLPVAFIDWDTIRPDDPIVEFGSAAWKYVPLGDDVYFEASDFPTRPALPRRLAVFARAYGLRDRKTLRWALHQAKQRSVEALKYFTITTTQGAAELRRVAAELEWLDGTVDDLVAELD